MHLNGYRDAAGNDSWFALTGCRKGTVPRALLADGPAAARRALDRLIEAFGRDRVLVELWDHGDPLDRHRNDALVQVAMQAGVEVVATNNVHYAAPRQRPLATALAAIRSRRSLDEIDGWLPAAGGAHLRIAGGAGPALRALAGSSRAQRSEIAEVCAFELSLAAPELPDLDVPAGHTDMSWLRELTRRGAALRYPSTHPKHEEARRQIEYELGVIEQLGFPGYFLLLVDIVECCRRLDIYCQGRGSAANSAVCYALSITKADAVDARPLVRAVPVGGARRATRHRPRHRARPPRGGHPVRLRQVRTRPGGAGRQRHHLPAPLGAAGDGEGLRALTWAGGRARASGSTDTEHDGPKDCGRYAAAGIDG